MPPEETIALRTVLSRNRGLIFPLLIVTSVLVIVAPLPPLVMDLLLACNITAAVVILLTTVHVSRPLDFSVFPAVLLGTTLARLVLNVASTRLILTNGMHGTAAAGGVIESFGQFVTGGSLVVGLSIFLILITIQFLVITKGATRISEVAARFALDGMPGKQMAIDADLTSGLITQEQAQTRRADVTQQADFYAAMDGASKFVRGDALASIAITLINILGGLYVGIVQNQLDFSEAVRVFTTLTIGDGLVTQVPAFLISLAAGLIVTRSSTRSDLSNDIIQQVFRYPTAMFIASGFLVIMSFTGLPASPLLILAGGCLTIGWLLRENADKQSTSLPPEPEPTAASQHGPASEGVPNINPMDVELGVGLLRLVDSSTGGDLLERVSKVREKVAREMGFILPKVRIRDNIHLAARQYQIKVRGETVAEGEVYPDGLFAIDTGQADKSVPLHGIHAVDPAFGQSAQWIEPADQQRAEVAGYQVAHPAAVIMTHLTETVREHSAEILTRQQVHLLLEHLKQSSPRIVEELIPDLLKTSQVHQVLRNLLAERIPIRDLESILETLGSFVEQTRDLGMLTEHVRKSLSRTICQKYRDERRVLHAVMLDPGLEDELAAGLQYTARGWNSHLPAAVINSTRQETADQLRHLTSAGHFPVVVCGSQIRAGLRFILASTQPRVVVIGLGEITRDTNLRTHGYVAKVADTSCGHTAELSTAATV